MEETSHHPSMHLATNFITITLRGNLDTSIAYELTRVLLDGDRIYIELCFVPQRDSIITDMGIVLLMMFLSRAKRKKTQVMFKLFLDGKVRFINNPPSDYHSLRSILSTLHTPTSMHADRICRTCPLP